MSAINISKNSVQNSRTKHIDIIHHFIRELVGMNIVKIDHIRCGQIADIFTKALEASQFVSIWSVLGLCIMDL